MTSARLPCVHTGQNHLHGLLPSSPGGSAQGLIAQRLLGKTCSDLPQLPAGKQQDSHTDTLCPPNIRSIQVMPQSSKLKVSTHRPMSPRSLRTGKGSKGKASSCLHRPEPSVDRGSISPSLTTETKHEAQFEVLAYFKTPHVVWKGHFQKELLPDFQRSYFLENLATYSSCNHSSFPSFSSGSHAGD